MSRREKNCKITTQQEFDNLVEKLTEKQLKFIREYFMTLGERAPTRCKLAAVAAGYSDELDGMAYRHGHYAIHYARTGRVIRAIEHPGEFTPDRKSLDEALAWEVAQ